MELTAEQLIVIGIVVSVISQVLKYLAQYLGYTPSKLVMTVVVFVVSFGLAYLFLKPGLPDPSSPTFWPELVSLLTILAGAAMTIYNVVLERLMEAFVQRTSVLLKHE
jgi:drug/metabolite transporter (DMT)-like permease